jgi:large subunit ribosomal protein L12
LSEYVHAALLLHAVKRDITAENVKAVVKATGIDPDDSRVKALISSLADVNIDEVLRSATVTPVTTSAAPQAAEAKPEGKKAEEEKNEEEITGLGALFG